MLVANLTVYKFIYLLVLLTFCGFVCSTIFDYVSVHNSIAKSIQYHIFDWKSHKYCTFILKRITKCRIERKMSKEYNGNKLVHTDCKRLGKGGYG